MIEPTADDVIGAVITTLERDIAPNVTAADDGYTASLCRTVGQMLRSVRSRLRHEEAALIEDNAELRNLLGTWSVQLPPDARREVDEILAGAGEVPTDVAVTRLQDEAIRLRRGLVVLIEALPDPAHPARAAGRAYLSHQLERERLWQVDAFDGPRR
ncbi:hypothetical protein HFP15_29790 [Amycolatopsis sp. K13G38]|uniref:Uncharacterized protein n=1 Tax=Amycolatopsis acididurans TaxID=2724524 RepID=A0ABX1JF88_9PSEU|nr:hypothetical protein [Amycolatopsis acididurans]NKQ57070.1 hypothetical protein [Amycolatopsis acididurans]